MAIQGFNSLLCKLSDILLTDLKNGAQLDIPTAQTGIAGSVIGLYTQLFASDGRMQYRTFMKQFQAGGRAEIRGHEKFQGKEFLLWTCT